MWDSRRRSKGHKRMSTLLGRRLLVVGIAAALAATAGWALWRSVGQWNGAPHTAPSSVAPASLGALGALGPSADEEGTLPAARVRRPPDPTPESQPAPRHGPSRASPPPVKPRGLRDLRSAPSPPPERPAQPRSQSDPGALPSAQSQGSAGRSSEAPVALPLPGRSPSESGDGPSPPLGASGAGSPGTVVRMVPPRAITSAGTEYPVEAFRLP